MNLMDMAIIAIVGFCFIRGIFKGLINELSAIIGVLGGFYAAYTYYMRLDVWLISWIPEPGYRHIVEFLLIFVAVFMLVSLLGILIKYLLSIAFLGWVDRFCGAGFGIVKGVLIVSVLLISLTAFLPKKANLLEESLLSPYVSRISQGLAMVISPEMKQRFNQGMVQYEKSWRQHHFKSGTNQGALHRTDHGISSG